MLPSQLLLLLSSALLPARSVRALVPASQLLPPQALETIRSGRIAVLPNWLPAEDVAALRGDAQSLHRAGHFSADALAAYGAEQTTKFDASKDRTVLRLGQWRDKSLGDKALRERFGRRMASLRTALAAGLERPKLDRGMAATGYGSGSTEISYTRYGPGAFLKRHIDEHHEELKLRRGWEKPTRRSISWLVYLNEADWDARRDGGELRCFERKHRRVAPPIGACANGALQVGLLRATATDPVERPVFLDSRRNALAPSASSAASSFSSFSSSSGNCAMYVVDDGGAAADEKKCYITNDFFAEPVLFLVGDFFGQQLLKARKPDLAARFHYLEPPKSAAASAAAGLFASSSSSSSSSTSGVKINTSPSFDEEALNVAPDGGTLVLFDSVTLPHEVLPTLGRERWAASGWFHEDQQTEHHAPSAAAAAA
jgi:hypothetical protein